MKILLITGLILLTTNSCQDGTKLSESKTFHKTFSEKTIQELQLLFDFFNTSISSTTDCEDLTDCYWSLFDQLLKSEENGSIDLPLSFEEQMKVYERISKSTFNEIWAFGIGYNYREAPNDTFNIIGINSYGKYIQFLKEVGQDYPMIKGYTEGVEAAGDIPPSIIAGILMNYKQLDIKDTRVKFIIAIHYLTLNDRSKRVEKINKNGG
jgi:hypothetical protein